MRRTIGKIILSALTAALFFTAGVVLPKGADVRADTPAGGWVGGEGQRAYDGDTGLWTISAAAVFGNKTDILQAPDRTVYFQMRLFSTLAWSGFYFLNGQTGLGSVSWASGNVTEYDKFPHFIINDGDGQIHSPESSGTERWANTGTDGHDCNFIKSTVPVLSQTLTGVEIHIGTGADGDVSYIKINDSLLETDSGSALACLKADLFPEGCYFGIHMNSGAGSTAALSEFGTPIVTSADEALKGMINVTEAVPVESDASFTVRNIADVDNVTLTLNGTAVPADMYTAAPVAGDANALTFTVKKGFWQDAGFWSGREIRPDSYFSVESGNGKAILEINLRNNAPPEIIGSSYRELTASSVSAAFEFTCALSGGGVLSAGDLEVFDGVRTGEYGTAPLTAGVDYTLSYENDGGRYTFTLTETYLKKATTFTSTNNGKKIRVKIGSDSLDFSVYRRPAASGWYARDCDIKAPISGDDYYAQAMMAVHVPTPTGTTSRIFYNAPLDVTKPIFMECNSMCDSISLWGLMQVSDSLSSMDYFTNEFAKESKLQVLFFPVTDAGNRYSIQKFHGFEEDKSTNASYGDASKDKILVELYFGETVEEGYMKVNGVYCGRPASTQSDFADKKAYIGWFFANGQPNPDSFVFRPNAHVNALAIVDPFSDADYKMDIGAPTDFSLTLASYEKNDVIAVKDDGGAALAPGTDYTFDAQTGRLTLKAEYFARLTFAKSGTFSLWNETAGNGTKFTIAYSSSVMHAAKIVFRGTDETGDVKFSVPEIANAVSMMMDGAGNALAADKWSFENGALTLSASLIGGAGIYEFIAVAHELHPLYVYVDDFDENGGVALSEKGSIEKGTNGAYMLEDGMSYRFARTFDLGTGCTFKIDFKCIPGYYGQDGRNPYGGVTFVFLDPYSGNSVYATLYADYSDEDAEMFFFSTLYLEYKVINAEGGVLASGGRSIDVSKGENPSALGVHSLRFYAKEGALAVTVDSARDLTISAEELGGFSMSAVLCGVEITESAAQEMQLGLIYFDGRMVVGYNPLDLETEETATPVEEQPVPVDPENPGTESESSGNGGCGSALGGGIAAGCFMPVLLSYAGFSLRRKRGD